MQNETGSDSRVRLGWRLHIFVDPQALTLTVDLLASQGWKPLLVGILLLLLLQVIYAKIRPEIGFTAPVQFG